jgi:hypothetical protein
MGLGNGNGGGVRILKRAGKGVVVAGPRRVEPVYAVVVVVTAEGVPNCSIFLLPEYS